MEELLKITTIIMSYSLKIKLWLFYIKIKIKFKIGTKNQLK